MHRQFEDHKSEYEWFRNGDFLEGRPVLFYTANPKSVVRAVIFTEISNFEIGIKLIASAAGLTQVLDGCKEICDGDASFGEYQGYIFIKASRRSVSKLTKLFVHLHEKKHLRITNELLFELEQLSNYSLDPEHDKSKFKHVLSENISTAYVNPILRQSKTLATSMAIGKVSFEEIKETFTRGENPNQVAFNSTLLYLIVLRYDISFLKLALCYGGNPFLPNQGWDPQAAIDYLLFQNQTEKLQVINIHFTPLKKSLNQNHIKIKICKIKKERGQVLKWQINYKLRYKPTLIF